MTAFSLTVLYTFHLLHFSICFPAILCCKFVASFRCSTFSANPHYLELKWVKPIPTDCILPIVAF